MNVFRCKKILFTTVIVFLFGCDTESIDEPEQISQEQEITKNQETIDDDPIATCMGFNTPRITLAVNDADNQTLIIDNASVEVTSTSENETISTFAPYITKDDDNIDTKKNSYSSILTINAGTFTVKADVSVEGYHTFVTEQIPFDVDTSCGGDNLLSLTIFLCRIESSACSASYQELTVVEKIVEKMESWNASNSVSYTFVYEATGFNPAAGNKWQIQVYNDEVIHVASIGETTPFLQLQQSNAPTINTLFDEIKSCSLSMGCKVSSIAYHDEEHYPLSYQGTYFSEWSGFKISSFVAQ